jgi:hypothetical protein
MSKATHTPVSLRAFSFDYMFKAQTKRHWSFKTPSQGRANKRVLDTNAVLQPTAKQWESITLNNRF